MQRKILYKITNECDNNNNSSNVIQVVQFYLLNIYLFIRYLL